MLTNGYLVTSTSATGLITKSSKIVTVALVFINLLTINIMVLGFKLNNKQGKPTGFPEKIIAGTKIHTLRADLNKRWKEGNSIQFATGVRTSSYSQFADGFCRSVQTVQLNNHSLFTVSIDGRMIIGKELERFAKNDGFDSVEEFVNWFNPLIDQHKKERHAPLRLRLIHWTYQKY